MLKRIRNIISIIFRIMLVFFLAILLIREFNPGYFEKYISMRYFLVVVVSFGILTGLLRLLECLRLGQVQTWATALSKLVKRQTKLTPYLCVLLALVLVGFFFTSDLQVFAVIMSVAVFFLLMRFNGGILIGSGLILLVVCAIILAVYENEVYASQIANYSYWFLVGGIVCELVEVLGRHRNATHSISKNP